MSSPAFIAPVLPLESTTATASSLAPAMTANAQGAEFGKLVQTGLQQINQQLLTSQTDLQQLALGDVQNLHHVMIRLEETRQHFQLFMQLRNRLLDAYQELMRTSV